MTNPTMPPSNSKGPTGQDDGVTVNQVLVPLVGMSIMSFILGFMSYHFFS